MCDSSSSCQTGERGCSCEIQGEDELDEEDMMDLMRDQQRRVNHRSLPRGGALAAIRTAQVGGRVSSVYYPGADDARVGQV